MFSEEDFAIVEELESATFETGYDIWPDENKRKLGNLLRKIVNWIQAEDTRALEASEYD